MATPLFSETKIKLRQAAPVAALTAVVGAVVIWASFAAGPIAFEPETGTLAAGATTTTVTGQSGTGAVKFNAAATPTPTPTPTPTGGFQANCIVSPHVCGYPDATNTGVPAGTVLTNSGSITVTTPGAIIQNLRITDGQIVIKANNVTIKNTLITGCTYYPIDNDYGATGLVVQDTEINSTCSATTAGLSFQNYTAIRVHVHGSADGFKANNNVTIRDSYIHDLWVTADSHNDGTQSTGGSNVTITHNTYDVGTGGVCIQFGSADSGWNVANNLFHCTGWAINGGTNVNNSSFTNNRFARVSGWYGPMGFSGTGNTISGNYYDDTGAIIP